MELIRSCSPLLRPTRVALVGSGAVANTWEPLRTAIRKTIDEGFPDGGVPHWHFPLETSANMAFWYRMQRIFLFRALKAKSRVSRRDLDWILEIGNFRRRIGEEYNEALQNNLIFLQPELAQVQQRLNPQQDAVITTNWDELLWRANSFCRNIIQLHGIASIPNSIILPTETSVDDQIFAFDQDFISRLRKISLKMGSTSERIDELLAVFTRGEMTRTLEQAHREAVRWFEAARELVIWGVGLNAYDAELLAVLRAAYGGGVKVSPLEKIIVINTGSERIDLVAHITGFDQRKIEFIKAS